MKSYLMIGALTGTMLLAGCSLSDFGLGNGASDDKTNHHKRINRIKIVIRNLIIVLIIRKNNDANSENSVKDLNQAEKVALQIMTVYLM